MEQEFRKIAMDMKVFWDLIVANDKVPTYEVKEIATIEVCEQGMVLIIMVQSFQKISIVDLLINHLLADDRQV